jgi:predicted RNA-binding Zn-ribbon protein involved in translation (DUF1610 family)
VGKRAIIEGIVAITVRCPDCGEAGENELGSQLIEAGQRVTCPLCCQELIVSQTAFKPRGKKMQEEVANG